VAARDCRNGRDDGNATLIPNLLNNPSGSFFISLFVALVYVPVMSATAAEPSPAWEPGISLAPYGWLAGIDGSLGTKSDDLDPGDSIGLPDLLEVSLDGELKEIGFMFYGEWRGERWTAMFDSVWVNASQKADASITRWLPSSDVEAGIDGNVYLLSLGYRAMDWQRSTLTVFAGLRRYDLEATIDAEGGLLPQPVSASVSHRWNDAVVGARWSLAFNEDWALSLLGDLGFGESDSSAEFSATLNYRFTSLSVIGGFRYLALDYETSDYKIDLALYGPMVGLAWRF
jgi:hypothetical protein